SRACSQLDVSKRLEGDDRAGVLDARNDLHLLGDEMADVGSDLDVELRQQIELAGRGVDFGRDFGVSELVGDLVGFAGLALDLHEERNHARLRRGDPRATHELAQSSKIAATWQPALCTS